MTLPKATFRLEWLPSDRDDNLILVAKVWAVTVVADAEEQYHVGDLMYNGNEWLFYRVDRSGDTLTDGPFWIPVDLDAEIAHRAELARLSGQESEMTGAVAALNYRRKIHRDEHRDLAEIGAKMEARKWWRGGYWGADKLCRTCGANPGENCRLPPERNCLHPKAEREAA